MNHKEKSSWYLLLEVTILFLLLPYAKKAMIALNVDGSQILSFIFIYGGLAYFVFLMVCIYSLRKKYGTSSKTLLRDKKFAFLFFTIIALGAFSLSL